MLMEDGQSQQGDPSGLSEAESRGGPTEMFEEEFDQTSVTKTSTTTRIKKENFEKVARWLPI